jgi:hypothetical protein
VATTKIRNKKLRLKTCPKSDRVPIPNTWGYVPSELLRHIARPILFHLRRDANGNLVPMLFRDREREKKIMEKKPRGVIGQVLCIPKW